MEVALITASSRKI